MATYQSKTWEDCIVEYPQRYKITHPDTTVEQIEIESDFGETTQEGDVFDAATFNNLESRINNGFNTCVETLTGTADPTSSVGKDGDTYYKTATEGNDTTIVGMFVRIAGSWLEVSVGGASLPQAEGSGF